jgi:DNA-binding transcriptional ArsR family regulator
MPRHDANHICLQKGLQMSFAFTDAALGLTGICPSQKLTLSIFAKHANSKGICWPSNQTVARTTGFDERTVRRHIESLKGMGIIERITREGRSAMTRIVWAMLAPKATPDIVPPTPDIVPPLNLSKESEYQITAQPTAPVVAESPAVAAIVVFKAMDTEIIDTAPVVDLVADTAPAIAPGTTAQAPADSPAVDLVPALPAVATDTEPALPEPVIAQAPADAPAVDVPAPADAPVVDNPLADCPPQALADFGLAREKKGRSATPTSTELRILGKQGAAVGLTIAQVIMLCAGEGWAWFQSKWATPPVMERFKAEWMPGQAPVTPVQLVFVPESAPPARPETINEAKPPLRELRPIRLTNWPCRGASSPNTSAASSWQWERLNPPALRWVSTTKH